MPMTGVPQETALAALESLPLALVVVDRHGRTLFANEQASRILGDELQLERSIPALEPEPLLVDREPLQDGHDVSLHMETSRRLGDGLVRAIRVDLTSPERMELIMLTPVARPAEGEPTPIERLREVEAVGRVGWFSWEIDSDIVTWSDELFRIHGLVPQAIPMTSESVRARYHPDDLPAHWAMIERCREHGESVMSDARIVRPDGSVRWERTRARPAREGERIVGVFGTAEDITERLARELELRQSLDEARRLAAENDQLRAEIESQMREVRASSARIVQASDTTRRQLERNLHDGAQARLTTLGLILRSAQSSANSNARPGLAGALERAIEELRAALADLRTLARGLHPVILTDEGLVPALEALLARMPLPVELIAPSLPRLLVPVETTAYHVAAEALTNAVNHGGASRAEVRLEHELGVLAIVITDDGRGRATIGPAGGLRWLADRVAALDGRLALHSSELAGTSLRVELPCP